jgi:cell shape-determining protein MreC
MLFAYLMLGGFIVLFLPTSRFQLIFAGLFHRPLAIGRAVSLQAETMVTAPDPLSLECEHLREANKILENKYANAQALLTESQKTIDELAGLRRNPEWMTMAFLRADVITDPKSRPGELLVHCGQGSAVAKGQYVMADYSIIGVVSETFSNTARVQLITAPRFKMPVQIANTTVQGILEGSKEGVARITQVQLTQSVNVDDDVLALKNPAAPGVPIITAKVTGLKRQQLLWDISVRPVCDVANIKSVFIIVPRK